MNNIEYTYENEDDNEVFELEIGGTYAKYYAATQIDPEEGGYIEIEEVTVVGYIKTDDEGNEIINLKRKAITKEIHGRFDALYNASSKLQESIQENMNESMEHCNECDYYDEDK